MIQVEISDKATLGEGLVKSIDRKQCGVKLAMLADWSSVSKGICPLSSPEYFVTTWEDAMFPAAFGEMVTWVEVVGSSTKPHMSSQSAIDESELFY